MSSTTTYNVPQPPTDPRRRLEWERCTCGMVGMGHYDSWAIQHVEKCPATAALREYDAEKARQAAR